MNRLPRHSGWAIFLLAASVLILQVSLTRIFSVMTYHHFTYLIIGLALLGFGAAGTVLSVNRRFSGETLDSGLLAHCAWLFSVATMVCFLAITRTRFEAMDIHFYHDYAQLFGLVMLLVFTVIPLGMGGLCIGYLISKSGDSINRVYFSDLAGAGCGSLASIFAINYLGAPAAILAVALLACLAAMLVGWRIDGRRRWHYPLTGVVAAGLAAICVVWPNAIPVPFPDSKLPDYHGSEFRWHVVARVDVLEPREGYYGFGGSLSREWDESKPPMNVRGVYQDGAAFTGIVDLEDTDPADYEMLGYYMQGCAYVIRSSPRVLVIGPGGGVDVAMALHHGASQVTGVDINPWTIDYTANVFDEFAGGLYNRDNVEIVCAEGRHFLTSLTGTDETFDVIQLSGVDTFTALASGAYALSENYVYTEEAMHDYFDRLSEDGIVSFSRWLFAPPRETLRLALTAKSALHEMGAEHPDKHIMVIAAPAWKGRSPWADTLVKRTPFTRAEVDTLRKWCEKRRFDMLYEPFVPFDAKRASEQFTDTSKYKPALCAEQFDRALRTPHNDMPALLADYPYNIRPVTDDNPFFFNYYRLKNLFESGQPSLGGDPVTRLPLGLLILLASVVQIVIIGAILIVWPMRSRVGGIRAQRGAVQVLVYFACLGLAFIMIEIMLLQKLMVFLGGPVYSMAVTLFALLIFSGLGSYLARGFTRRNPRLGGTIGLLLLGVVAYTMTWFLDEIVPDLMGLSHLMRGAVAVIAILPLGLLMGMPFPTGLRMAERLSPGFVPWAWCVNACATVLGSVGCILAAMATGFTTIIHAAIVIYGIALVAMLIAPRMQPLEDAASESYPEAADSPDETLPMTPPESI